MTARAPLLIVTGLRAEVRIAEGPGCLVIAGGGDSAGLAEQLSALDGRSLAAVVSLGIAGALDPTLAIGDAVIATAIRSEACDHAADAGIARSWSARLMGAGLPLTTGVIAGVDAPVAKRADKAMLGRRTGAIAVDMESHLAAGYAAGRGLPFAALRIISDGAEHALPPVAASAMRPDGSVDVAGVLKGLARDPRQIPALIRTARDAGVAFRRLRRVRGLLGDLLGLDL